jgi:FkbM family methyltransferase
MIKTVIEVGAYDGEDSLRFHKQGYVVYTFEPKEDLYNALVEKTKHLKNYNVIKKAVCLENGTTKFNICKRGGASSILPFRSEEELNKTWSPQRTDVHYSGLSYDVETTRLDTFIEENKLENMIIDFIHIDAQGVDLDCLKSLGKYINNVNAGVLETVKDVNKSIYIGQTENTLEKIEVFLKENNFKITDVSSNDWTGCEYNVGFNRNQS